MVSTTGMVVSLKTDLRFSESGQQGHGAQIIHYEIIKYRGKARNTPVQIYVSKTEPDYQCMV